MLAKSRALRPSGWPVVIRDIQRVRQGQMPLGKVPTGMQSTMRLDPPPEGESQTPAAEDGKKDAALRDRRRRRDNMIVWIAATFVAATVAFLAAYFVTLRML